MDQFFEQEQEFSNHTGTDADVESMKSIKLSKQNTFEILKEPRVLEKKKLPDLCGIPDTGNKRSLTVEKALRAISCIKVIERRTTRLPVAVCRELNKDLEIITNSIFELEIKVTHAEAKSGALETTAHNIQNIVMTEEVSREDQPRRVNKRSLNLRTAINTAAFATLIHSTEERNA